MEQDGAASVAARGSRQTLWLRDGHPRRTAEANNPFIAGIVVAGFATRLASIEFMPARPTRGQALRGLIGGVLLGWGTVIGLGCTVGTLLSGISAGAVSGWVFAAALLAGTTVTLRLGRRLGWLA